MVVIYLGSLKHKPPLVVETVHGSEVYRSMAARRRRGFRFKTLWSLKLRTPGPNSYIYLKMRFNKKNVKEEMRKSDIRSDTLKTFE